MAINRKKLVQKHNPIKSELNLNSPLTVGNSSIAFTADVTGMQTLYEEQKEAGVPLLTMADWGWHTALTGDGKTYTLDDVVMTEYPHQGRTVRYAVQKQPGNEEIYEWVRKNPHRYNLMRLGLIYKGNPIREKQLSNVHQELDLYTGVLHSSFLLEGREVSVYTLCHGEKDVLGFRIISEECANGNLQIKLELPYGSPEISGSDWDAEEKHSTQVLKQDANALYLLHEMDRDKCYLAVNGETETSFEQCGKHSFVGTGSEKEIIFTVALSKEELQNKDCNSNAIENWNAESAVCKECTFESCKSASIKLWQDFWENGGMVSFEGSIDTRAEELERRIILSLYLSLINSCTTMPPQETGLTVNSWYGKAHLEMHLWHAAYLPLWGRSKWLKKSLGWYHDILPRAEENAARNGYKGARWTKMVGPEGIDCPSKIATLLVWQQPHLLYMLELLYQAGEKEEFLREHWELVRKTAEFMVDFAVYNEEKQVYELVAPLIPAQERHKPMDTLNPVFEVEYWRVGLQLAIKWAKRLGEAVPEKWQHVADHMAEPAHLGGAYLAHEKCPSTFTEFAKDHPSMVAALGLLPGERINKEIMGKTLDKIYENWNFKTMWGWDFAMMAMTEMRLGNPERALQILLIDTEKNQYVLSGNNMQVSRNDLPLYMPGNGSMLLAVAMMAAGYAGCPCEHPGFPQDGNWRVQVEGMNQMPF